MTVVEVWPGAGGWYTELLAPLLAKRGKLYAAQLAAAPDNAFVTANLKSFADKLAARPDLYGKVEVTALGHGNGSDRAAGQRRPGRDVPQCAQLDELGAWRARLSRRCTSRSSPAACSAWSNIAATRRNRRIRVRPAAT